jgi:Protein kinase domain
LIGPSCIDGSIDPLEPEAAMASIFSQGTIFGPYTVGDLLGIGAVSEVYEARTADGAMVALKVLKGGAPLYAKREARLGQEGFALADVVHVNVAGFRGEGVVDGRIYLAMERVYGIDLRRLMAAEGGLLPLPRVLRIAYQAAEGLAAVHERGFLHRDVKPENVLVTVDDLVKITDFGSAWVGARGVATTQEQDLTSMLYASPEHLRRRAAGPASDVYALGLVLYEMAAGIHPMAPRPASATDIFTRQLVFTPPPLGTLASGDRPIPRELSDLVVRMIDKEPANRPPAGELGALLRAVLRPLLARPRAGAGGSIPGGATPRTAGSAGGTVRMAAAAAPAADAASNRISDGMRDGMSEGMRSALHDAVWSAPHEAVRSDPRDAVREALPPPAPFDDGAGGGHGPTTTPRAPATARDPAALTLRSAVRAPVTMPMSTMGGDPPAQPAQPVTMGGDPPAQPAERRSTAAPVERSASRASMGPSPARTSIAVAFVVLGLGAAGGAWFAAARDGGALATGSSAGTTGEPRRSAQPSPVPSTSASTSSAAAAPPASPSASPSVSPSAPRAAPEPHRGSAARPALKRGTILVP